jgi:hypothetical protein
MKPEDKKYVWWALLGIGVAALFYFLSASKQSSNANTVTVPYLVPQYQTTTGASPTADTSLSNQSNIIGSSPNSTVSNFSNPYNVASNAFEAPGTWGFMPNLTMTSPAMPQNTIQFGAFNSPNQLLPNAVGQAQTPVHA